MRHPPEDATKNAGPLTTHAAMLRLPLSFREAGGTWPCDRLGNLRVEREGANASPAQAGSDGANDGWERFGGAYGAVPQVPRPARAVLRLAQRVRARATVRVRAAGAAVERVRLQLRRRALPLLRIG